MEHPQVKEEELEGSQPKPFGEEQNITSIPSHIISPQPPAEMKVKEEYPDKIEKESP